VCIELKYIELYMSKTIDMIDTRIANLIHKFSVQGKVKLIGSSQYRGMLFTTDYDISTKLQGRAETLADHFKKVIQSIPKKSYYFMDFKCGLDKRFIYDFDKDSLNEYLQNPQIPKAYKDEIRQATGEEQVKLIRDLFILRWSPHDITRGYVLLIDGKHYSLEDALEDDTIIKLDIIIPVGNRFAEVSENYYYKQSPTESITKQLADDIEKYKHNNSMKSLKRLYSILQKVNPTDSRLTVLRNFFNSEVGLINKVKNDLEMLLTLTDKHFISFDKIVANVQMLKENLSNTTLVSPTQIKSLNNIKSSNFRNIIESVINYLLSIMNPIAKTLLNKLQ
jgi:hypothetical protein